MPGTGAPPAAATTPEAEKKDVQEPALAQERPVAPPPKVEKAQAPKAKRVTPFAPEPAAPAAPASPSSADLAPTEQRVAPSADALARSNAAPAPAATRAQSARMAAAPAAAAKEAATPEQRELERIARLRAEGKDDEADAALDAFRRAHPDYRIEPAMWERVRRH